MSEPIHIFWFRRDLRLHDNTGLHALLNHKIKILPFFIYDTTILDQLDRDDKRMPFLTETIQKLDEDIQSLGGRLWVEKGTPQECWERIIMRFGERIKGVSWNRDYEPGARARDQMIQSLCQSHGIPVWTHKDQCLFHEDDILKSDGSPYIVFTPYFKSWKAKLLSHPILISNCSLKGVFTSESPQKSTWTLQDLGFEKPPHVVYPTTQLNIDLVKQYHVVRNECSRPTSLMGLHLRFGTVSVRELIQEALKYNDVWLSELAWREFFMQILYHFPDSAERCFRKEYETLPWQTPNEHFEKWAKGETGYPLIDAGMRELNTTGFMHNRVRLVVASFLCKHLLIHWKHGERYFAKHLLDFDLASNVGNWQWCAGTGCDAAPYFRIFNPHLQLEKYDTRREYVSKWAPEYLKGTPPRPLIVEHDWARQRALDFYRQASPQLELPR